MIKLNLNVIDNGKKYLVFSLLMVILAWGIILTKGFNYGIDFSGGSLFQIKYETNNITLADVNTNLDEVAASVSQMNPNSRKVQISEDGTIIIRSQEISEIEKKEVLDNLKKLGKYDLQKEDKVGASIGEDLKKAAIYSLIIGSILIVMYITFRFEFSFAIAGILTLIQDISISTGVIALLGYEINTPFIAAILTILGYSINDTIVIFDRVRENLMRRKSNEETLEECMNKSVSQVTVRSLNTSITTLFSIIAILVFGGDSLKTFMVTLLVGILFGSYSSIFVATPVVYFLNKRKNNDMTDIFKEKDDSDERVEKILV